MIHLQQQNEQALESLYRTKPALVGMGIAQEVIPDFHGKMLLHAGPPISWDRMSGPMRGAVMGACMYEGWASRPQEAAAICERGEIRFDPCHHHQAVGPMAGVVSPKMPVFILKNLQGDNHSYATMNEGLGQVLRMGSYQPSVIDHLRWMEQDLFPILQNAIDLLVEDKGPMLLKPIIAQALHMGDELHNRNKAGTSLFFRAIAPYLVQGSRSIDKIAQAFRFIDSNDHFFLNLGMAAAKVSLDILNNWEGSSLVRVMARNGTDFGIQIAGLGNQWFTCPAAQPDVLLFPGFTPEDVNPDIGDSAIMETYGVGGFALASAPAIVQFVGGTPREATEFTLEMYEICLGENPDYTMPPLNFRGTPTGIDLLKVVETAITPILDTGAACKEAGRGQVGAGIVRMPAQAFVNGAQAFVDRYLA
jgi:hypothetical protein